MHRFKDRLKQFKSDSSGNALMLVAMGMPVLMGGAGYAVDTAQWYLIKRELQYAADQAAISGAWAQGNGAEGNVYQTRAYQEFDSNLSRAAALSPSRTATEENWDTGTNNSVRVNASASVNLPFSNIILKRPVEIAVTAKAYYDPGTSWQPCLLATDPTTSKGLWFKGNITIDAGCGAGALSTAADAIVTGGNASNLYLNYILSKGGIDDPHGKFAGQTTIPYMDNLFDPWKGLTPPNNSASRGSNPCSSSPAEYVAEVNAIPKDVTIQYGGSRKNNMQILSITENSSGTAFTDRLTNDTTPYTVGEKFESAVNTYSVGDLTDNGKKGDPRFVRTDQGTRYHYTVTKASQTGGAGKGNALPGTYNDFSINCDLQLAPGVYVIDGGSLTMNGQNSLSGSNVMFVLKNGASIRINGGAKVDLSPMSESDLVALGVKAEDAKRMDGMLIFQDPDDTSRSSSKINGGSGLNMVGKVYMPNTDLEWTGNADVKGGCLYVSAATITVSGNTDLSSFCDTDNDFTHSVTAAFTDERVRLVQ